jgi:ferredoxin
MNSSVSNSSIYNRRRPMKSDKEQDLFKELATMHGWPDSKYLPMIFKKMVTEDQANILLQFPEQSEKIAETLGLDQNIVDEHLQELFEKGLAFPTKKGWRINHIIDGLHDLTLSNTKFWDSYGGTEFADLWRAFERLEWWPEFVEHMRGMDVPLMRVVPAREAVQDNPGLLPEEDIREMYRKAESIVLIPCPCRREMYDRHCGTPDDMCITLNRSAAYNLKRGVGKELSVDEALEFMDTVREHSSVTIVPNTPNTGMVICNCHACCCLSFLSFNEVGAPLDEFTAPSRFGAVIDPENCIGCQKCIEACQFEALEMNKIPGMKKWKAGVIPDKCMGCGTCVVKCPKEDTISFKVVRPPDHIPQGELDVYAQVKTKKKD